MFELKIYSIKKKNLDQGRIRRPVENHMILTNNVAYSIVHVNVTLKYHPICAMEANGTHCHNRYGPNLMKESNHKNCMKKRLHFGAISANKSRYGKHFNRDSFHEYGFFIYFLISDIISTK